jgi:hypothetical protein
MITHDWGQALVPNCVQPPQSVFAGHVFIMSLSLCRETLCVGGGSGKTSTKPKVVFESDSMYPEPTVRMRPTGKKNVLTPDGAGTLCYDFLFKG